MLAEIAACRPGEADGEEVKRIAGLLVELNRDMLAVLRSRARCLAAADYLASDSPYGPSWPRSLPSGPGRVEGRRPES